MNLDALKVAYQQANQPGRVYLDHMVFIDQLLASSDREAIKYHYDLLTDRSNRDLYIRLRAAFVKRLPGAEGFLLEALDTEKDPAMRADILHLLGTARCPSARDLAVKLATDIDERVRDTAAFVLGWVGTPDDLREILIDRLLHDPSPLVRGDAATALRQVYFRLPKVKDDAVKALKQGLVQESNEEAQASIIATLQTLLKKRFGLTEPAHERGIKGDVPGAREKALKHLAKV